MSRRNVGLRRPEPGPRATEPAEEEARRQDLRVREECSCSLIFSERGQGGRRLQLRAELALSKPELQPSNPAAD